jgi:cytochrome c biogenesis protein CcmG/thiol:disulfide interchange protein DsbE
VSVRRQWLVVASVVVVLGAGLWLATTRLGAELFPLRIGSRAPDFTAMTLPVEQPAGAAASARPEPKGIDDYKGEVVLLNVWATWCKPCLIEMPSIERLQDSLGAKGLRIVAVSVDLPGMESRITAFARDLSLSFEILHDAPGRIRTQYQTTGVPETFIIGRDGRIRRRIIGADDWSSPENIAFLERLLAEPGGTARRGEGGATSDSPVKVPVKAP